MHQIILPHDCRAAMMGFVRLAIVLGCTLPASPTAAQTVGPPNDLPTRAADAFAQHRFVEALTLYAAAEAEGLDFSSVPLHTLRRGMAAYHQADFGTARRFLKSGGIALPRLQPYTEYFILRCLLAEKDYASAAKAAQSFQRTVDVISLVRASRLLAAEAYDALQDDASAIAEREAYLRGQQAANRAAVWYALAGNHRALDHTQSMLIYYRRIIDRQILTESALAASHDLVAHYESLDQTLPREDWKRHGDVLYRHRLYGETASWVAAHRRLFPEGSLATFMTVLLGRSQYYSQQYRPAIATLASVDGTTAETEDARNAILFTARSHLALGETNRSIAIYEQYADAFPTSAIVPEIWWKLGWILEGRGDYAGASEYYRKNTHRQNEYRERSGLRMGLSAFKAGDWTGAITAFDLLQGGRINDRVQRAALYWKGRALEGAGRNADARRVFMAVVDNPLPDYYTFRAAARLDIVPIPASPTLPDPPATLPPASFLADIDHGRLVSQIFDRPMGERLLRRLETQAGRRIPQLLAVLEGYQAAGLSGRAMRLALRLRAREYPEVPLHRAFRVHQAIYPQHYQSLVENSVSAPVTPALLFAIMRRESAFDERAISHAGAMGLVQLLPGTAREAARAMGMGDLSYEDILLPDNNIRLGARELRQRILEFSGFLPGAIGSYNAGAHVVKRWIARYGTADEELFIDSLEYSETRSYVKGVLQDYWIYQQLYALP